MVGTRSLSSGCAFARTGCLAHSTNLRSQGRLYAAADRCARRKERICRTASGIRSFGSFHGNMLTSAFGASIAASVATA
jgi:hypothetical protein